MGRLMKLVTIPASFFALFAGAAFGQSVISAHSGLVHYVEGQVLLDDKAIEVKYSQFPEVRNDQVLKTEEGRAEVLLTPGVFLRLAENSGFRMLSNKLTDTRVEAMNGSLMLEHGEVTKDNQVTLLFKDRAITFLKSGLYRLDAENGTFRVYQGEARVTTPEQSIVAKQAHMVELQAAVLASAKFDPKVDDEFYRWASRRAGYLAMANVSAAKSLHDSGYSMTSGLWSWNPWYGMFTYVPFGSSYYSPFGYSFYNPLFAGQFFYPGYYGYGGYGYAGGGGGTAVARRGGRYNSVTNFSVPARPATASASIYNTGGRAFSGGYTHGGTMAAGSGLAVPAPAARGGGASSASSGGGMSSGGGGRTGGGGGGGGAGAGGGGGGSHGGHGR